MKKSMHIVSKLFAAIALPCLSAALLPLAAQATPVTVAVIAGNSGADSSAQVAAQLNDDSYFDFSATVLSGAQAASSLSGYSVVLLGGSGYSNQEYSDATLASIRSFMQFGGGVVSAGWYRFAQISTSGQGALDADFITPVVTGGSYDYSAGNTLHITNTANAITNGVSDISVSGCCIELATDLDAGTTALGTSSGNTALAYQDGVGRSAYIGLLYFANTGYNNAGLRTGDADRLLEQSVAWAANGTGGNTVPEPDTLALLALGLVGLGLKRYRSV